MIYAVIDTNVLVIEGTDSWVWAAGPILVLR